MSEISFSKYLKELREEKNLTIAKLAEKLKPQFDLDELANKVSEKLNTKKTESKEPENAGFKRFLF